MALDPEVRQALHEIRDAFQAKFLQVDKNSQDIAEMKKLLEDQASNHETLQKIDKFMDELAVSLTWANRIRAIVLWVGAPATVVIGAWKAWKGIE